MAELLGGAGIDHPSRHANVTFRKAPRLQRGADHEQMELGGVGGTSAGEDGLPEED